MSILTNQFFYLCSFSKYNVIDLVPKLVPRSIESWILNTENHLDIEVLLMMLVSNISSLKDAREFVFEVIARGDFDRELMKRVVIIAFEQRITWLNSDYLIYEINLDKLGIKYNEVKILNYQGFRQGWWGWL